MEYRNKLKTLLFGQDMESMVCHGLRKCMKDFPQIEADYGKARENIIHQLGEEAQRLCQSVRIRFMRPCFLPVSRACE